jgi:hypothetical protein
MSSLTRTAAAVAAAYVDDQGAYHGFLRKRSGAIRTIDAPGAALTQGGTAPLGINDHSRIVGGTFDDQGGGRGFLYERGRFTPIDAPGAATYTRPLDINNRGQIVGDYDTEPPDVEGLSSKVDIPGAPNLSALPLGLGDRKEER